MCEHCGRPRVQIDAYKTSTRVVQQVDMLFDSLTKPVLSKVSQSTKEWSDLIGENEFIDKKSVIKRVKGYEKRRTKLFKDRKKKFKDAVKEKQGGLFGMFRKRELTYEDRLEIFAGVYSVAEIREMYYEMYVLGEMRDDHRYAVEQIVKKKNIELDPVMLLVVGYLAEEYADFSRRCCSSMVDTISERSVNIVVYGLEQGKTTKEIMKDIEVKFNYYIEKEGVRIARTEAIRAMNNGLVSGFERMGVKHYEVIHNIDACPICIEIADGGPYKTLDKVGKPPFHPSCKCCIVPVL